MQHLIVIILAIQLVFVTSLYTGKFDDENWIKDTTKSIDSSRHIKFTVALKLNNVNELHDEFLAVSLPKSEKYGKFYDLNSLSKKFGASPKDKNKVIEFFFSMPTAQIESGQGDFLVIQASIQDIETLFDTTLSWKRHSHGIIEKRAIRADSDISVPDDIADLISFISLNSPITHAAPTGSAWLKKKHEDANLNELYQSTISVSSGNSEAIVTFKPVCGDGTVNVANPPCSNKNSSDVPFFLVQVSSTPNSVSSTYSLTTDPLVFQFDADYVYCYLYNTNNPCAGVASSNCYCKTKISALPKYTQLQLNVTYGFNTDPAVLSVLGVSDRFALTDVATASFLASLYDIPKGLTVQYGSNQSVAEFYGEFYSNSDLTQFFALSGLPNASIPSSNVFGDLPNDQTDPGGEAQLDVEYIMALARNADTFFYSFADLNPYSDENEGFLAYLYFVGNQSYPPLVHSLSYGDVEAAVFNQSKPGAEDYGNRCDQEFMKMGLRGLTVLFSSDVGYACKVARPSWPAASPYVTAVGGTQLTNKYLPGCGSTYYVTPTTLPNEDRLTFECTGTAETTCTSTFGGVITSGGGFSAVSSRPSWQADAVDAYLSSAKGLPPLSYFNSYGRGYPDVATYASNYFVYLGGRITRESGTSASAPVMAAMVTLWNDIRLAYGQSPLGFIAPFLYEIYATNPEAFNDITTGNNACGVGYSIDEVSCCAESFPAAPGWDAVTGLGSPNWNVIANLVLNASTPFPSVSASAGLSTSSSVTYSTTTTSSDSENDVAVGLGVYSTLLSTLLLIYTLYNHFVKAPNASKNDAAAFDRSEIKTPIYDASMNSQMN